MKTFNKRGDRGETSLLHGVRVPKCDPRCEAYGTIDEVVSALGLARALALSQRVRDIVFSIQKELFTVGAELATPQEQESGRTARYAVSEDMAQRLEDTITQLEDELTMPREFIIPGSSPAAAALDLARAIARRAERRAVALREEGAVKNERILSYLNRLGDLLFTLARYEEMKGG